jgi:ATP-dependent DNA helicase PIF1
MSLQKRCENIVAVIIDEFSMISGREYFFVDSRLQQGYNNALPFGGIPIAWVGDPGQIPPVGGLSSSCNTTSKNIPISGTSLSGHLSYMRIKTVMKLTDVVRQNGPYMQLLLRLRDGKSTEDDWRLLMETCTIPYLTEERIQKFNSNNSIWLFNTNKENYSHNIKQLKLIGNPIILVKAEHDSISSVGKSTETARKLSPKMYLCIDAKIMLLWNINISVGLVNGSTGIVKEFIYEDNHVAPNLPTYIIIHFDDYTGPPFFTGEGQEKWVPVEPETFKWGGKDEDDHFRKQFPICLAWALTTWKSQGMLSYDRQKGRRVDKLKS